MALTITLRQTCTQLESCIRTHAHTYTRTHVGARTRTHIHTHARTCTHTHTQAHTHIHTHTHPHTHKHTHHTHTHTHTHTFTHAPANRIPNMRTNIHTFMHARSLVSLSLSHTHFLPWLTSTVSHSHAQNLSHINTYTQISQHPRPYICTVRMHAHMHTSAKDPKVKKVSFFCKRKYKNKLC